MARPKKIVAVYHRSLAFDTDKKPRLDKMGKHIIMVSQTGTLKTGKSTQFKGTFAEAVQTAKKRALRLGEGAHLYTHGASKNYAEYVVDNGKLVKLRSFTMRE